jgi:hypothetical protein
VFAGRGATSQLGEFQAWDAANDFDPATSLFVIWLFPNDVFYASATGSLDPTVIGSAIANIASIIQILAAAGRAALPGAKPGQPRRCTRVRRQSPFE